MVSFGPKSSVNSLGKRFLLKLFGAESDQIYEMDRPWTLKRQWWVVIGGALAWVASGLAHATFERPDADSKAGTREVRVAHPSHEDPSVHARSETRPAQEHPPERPMEHPPEHAAAQTAELVKPAQPAHAEAAPPEVAHTEIARTEVARTELARAELAHADTRASEIKHAEVAAPEKHETTPFHAEAKKTEKHSEKIAEAKHETKSDSQPSLFHVILHKTVFWLADMTEKLQQIREAEEENLHLKQENASLRLALETRAFEVHAKSASERTQDYANRLERDTWALVGRTVAGIHYEIPQSLQPGQIFTLGLDYFSAGEDEKAAKIFTFLAGLEEGEYNSPEHMLLNGVVWFRLDNLRISDAYFEKIVSSPTATDRQKAQARIWRALVAERKGDHGVAQTMLKDLLAHHPKAPEVKLVNPLRTSDGKEAEREPASGHEE